MGELGVVGRGGLEEIFLGIGAQHGGNFALFEFGGAERRHGGLEERQQPARVLEKLRGEVQRVAGAGVDVARGGEGGGEGLEEGIDGGSVIDEVEKERGRQRNEEIFDVGADQLTGRATFLERRSRVARDTAIW